MHGAADLLYWFSLAYYSVNVGICFFTVIILSQYYCVYMEESNTVQLNANLMTARGLQVENAQVNVHTRAGKDQGVRHGFSPCGREVMAPVCYKLL